MLFFVQSFLFFTTGETKAVKPKELVRLVERFEDNIVVCIKANISMFFIEKLPFASNAFSSSILHTE
jgi:hypothetical protein